MPNPGAVYVYRNLQGTWLLEDTLTAGTPIGDFDQFGASLPLDEDVILISASDLPDDPQTRRGAALIFRFDGYRTRDPRTPPSGRRSS
jgi:hypothetical protein